MLISLLRDTESCLLTSAFVLFSQKPVWHATVASTPDPLCRTWRKQRRKGDNAGLNPILNDKLDVFLGFYPLKQQLKNVTLSDRRIFVCNICLRSKSDTVCDGATKTLLLNIERVYYTLRATNFTNY